MKIYINPAKNKWTEIIQRPQINNAALKNIVSEILLSVKQNGDEAIKKYSLQFDGVELNDLKVSDEEIKAALLVVNNELKLSLIHI